LDLDVAAWVRTPEWYWCFAGDASGPAQLSRDRKRSVSEIAFHEKAGRSQVEPWFFMDLFCSSAE
jgi:hypothetical protein